MQAFPRRTSAATIACASTCVPAPSCAVAQTEAAGWTIGVSLMPQSWKRPCIANRSRPRLPPIATKPMTSDKFWDDFAHVLNPASPKNTGTPDKTDGTSRLSNNETTSPPRMAIRLANTLACPAQPHIAKRSHIQDNLDHPNNTLQIIFANVVKTRQVYCSARNFPSKAIHRHGFKRG